jgi:hypothetical protein
MASEFIRDPKKANYGTVADLKVCIKILGACWN